jgi:hypothetical protein
MGDRNCSTKGNEAYEDRTSDKNCKCKDVQIAARIRKFCSYEEAGEKL